MNQGVGLLQTLDHMTLGFWIFSFHNFEQNITIVYEPLYGILL